MYLALNGKVLLATLLLPGHRTFALWQTVEMTMRRKKATPLDWRNYMGCLSEVKK